MKHSETYGRSSLKAVRYALSKMGDIDWSEDLTATGLSYTGEEVCTAEEVTYEQIEPALPPAGVAASIPLLPLLEGETRRCVADPSLVGKCLI